MPFQPSVEVNSTDGLLPLKSMQCMAASGDIAVDKKEPLQGTGAVLSFFCKSPSGKSNHGSTFSLFQCIFDCLFEAVLIAPSV